MVELPKKIICTGCGKDITNGGAIEVKENEWYCVSCHDKKEKPNPEKPEKQDSSLLYGQRNMVDY